MPTDLADGCIVAVRRPSNLSLHAELEDRWSAHGYTTPRFRLQELGNIRHVTVRFFDGVGGLLETNEHPGNRPVAPRWFAGLIRGASQPVPSQTQDVSFHGKPVGRPVIAPDPSYETDEMWATCSGLLELLLSFFVLVIGLVWWAASRALRPVERILQALDALRGGNLSARLPSFELPELSRISVGFNHMAETLEQSVTENQRLTRRLLETQETERTRIARELHDEIGQRISAIHADAAASQPRRCGRARKRGSHRRGDRSHQADRTQHAAASAAPIMEGLGLEPALRDLVSSFQQRNPQVICVLRCAGNLAGLDGKVGVAICRVIQECLTNIAVHATAHNATVEVLLLPPAEDALRLRVTVADDGVGFFLLSVNRGLGLTGIKERVEALGGTCHIHAHPGQGSRIGLEVPLRALGSDLDARAGGCGGRRARGGAARGRGRPAQRPASALELCSRL